MGPSKSVISLRIELQMLINCSAVVLCHVIRIHYKGQMTRASYPASAVQLRSLQTGREIACLPRSLVPVICAQLSKKKVGWSKLAE